MGTYDIDSIFIIERANHNITKLTFEPDGSDNGTGVIGIYTDVPTEVAKKLYKYGIIAEHKGSNRSDLRAEVTGDLGVVLAVLGKHGLENDLFEAGIPYARAKEIADAEGVEIKTEALERVKAQPEGRSGATGQTKSSTNSRF